MSLMSINITIFIQDDAPAVPTMRQGSSVGYSGGNRGRGGYRGRGGPRSSR